MKNFDLTSMGVHEMNALEMQETDGGFFCAILIIAAVCLLSSCNNTVNVQITGGNATSNQTGGTMQADSTLNNNTVKLY